MVESNNYIIINEYDAIYLEEHWDSMCYYLSEKKTSRYIISRSLGEESINLLDYIELQKMRRRYYAYRQSKAQNHKG